MSAANGRRNSVALGRSRRVYALGVATRTLVVISSDPDGPVVRHRWRMFDTHLRDAGIELEVVPWPKGFAGRREALQRAARADAVVVSSRLMSLYTVRKMRAAARRLIFDFDDALPYRDSSRGATRSRTRARRFAFVVAAADLVIAGNAYLRELVRDLGADARVVPTVVEVPAEPPPPEPDGEPVLGWIGSRATVPYLQDRAAVFSALVTAGRRFRLRVISDVAPSMPTGIVVEHVPWRLDAWRDALLGAHIGLAPLSDDPWARGKCGLRVLQIMSVGRPVVASAVGVQVDQVRNGETGYLSTGAPGGASFLDGLQRLLDRPEDRRAMGLRAWEDARSHWSVEAWGPRLVNVVAQALDAVRNA